MLFLLGKVIPLKIDFRIKFSIGFSEFNENYFFNLSKRLIFIVKFASGYYINYMNDGLSVFTENE